MTWKVYKPEMVAYIHVWGPEPVQDKHGDEVPYWYVGRFDSDDNEILSTSYTSSDSAVKSAIAAADKLDVELINEAGYE